MAHSIKGAVVDSSKYEQDEARWAERAVAEESQRHSGWGAVCIDILCKTVEVWQGRELLGDIMQPTYPNRTRQHQARQHFNYAKYSLTYS